MDKTRPVVIISADGIGSLPVKLAAPCTTSKLPPVAWRMPVQASVSNGLDRDTTVDLMQIRSLSVNRLVRKLGVLDPEDVEDIAAMVAVIVDYQ